MSSGVLAKPSSTSGATSYAAASKATVVPITDDVETGTVEMVKGMKPSTPTSTPSLPLPDMSGFDKDKKDGKNGAVSELVETIKTSSAAIAAVIGVGNRMTVKYVHLTAIQMIFISQHIVQ